MTWQPSWPEIKTSLTGMERRAGRMERPSSVPRPRIRRAPGSLESSHRGAHFAVNMCCLCIRAPAFAHGNHLFATSLSISSAIATALLTALSRMHVGPPPTRRPPHRTRYFRCGRPRAALNGRPADLFAQTNWHLHFAGTLRLRRLADTAHDLLERVWPPCL